VPLDLGRAIAEQHNVLHLLRPLFDFVPGDKSPPPAPKHTTAASTRPKVVKQSVAPKRAPSMCCPNGFKTPYPYIVNQANRAEPTAAPSQQPSELDEDFDNSSVQLLDEMTPISTIASGDEEEMFESSQLFTGSRKRKRTEDRPNQQDQLHMVYADALLDYFVDSTSPFREQNKMCIPPSPPENFQVDRPIDDRGHTALHWAAAMADVDVVKFFIAAGANVDVHSISGETPLMRAVLFTNNYERRTMPKMINDLKSSIPAVDSFGSTVFHHIAATTGSKVKLHAARYYINVICQKMSEDGTADDVSQILDMQDDNGDTALTIAARNGARKCVRALIAYHASPHIQNSAGETADSFIVELNKTRDELFHQASSSPFQKFDSRLSRHGQLRALSSIQFHVNPHHSETAMAVSQKLAPLIMQETEKLASAYDGELMDRERDLHDANRLLENNKSELRMTLQKASEVSAFLEGDGHVSEAEGEELRQLERQLESVIEISQREHLQRLVENQEIDPSCDMQQAGGEMWISTADDILDKLKTAALLLREKDKRRSLISEIVQHASMAGMGERHNDYKRLISKCIDMDVDDVEGALPELLAFLEVDKDGTDIGLDQEPIEQPVYQPNEN
jgi:transcription factor MBP1